MSDNEKDHRQAAELEKRGDKAAATGGEAAAFYRNAQKILIPTGVQWSDAEEYDRRLASFDRLQHKIWALGERAPRQPPPEPSEAYRAFSDSMTVTYEKWHDGIGYDLDALGKLTEAERGAVADMLLQRTRTGSADWRDIEALGALNVPEARKALERALKTSKPETRLHVARALLEQGVAVEIDKIIADVLRRGSYGEGRALALDLAAEHATPYLRSVLLDCARDGHPDVRVHAAALCLYLAGKAKEPFDWTHRPFFLQFGDDDPAVRARAYAELCRRIGATDGAWPADPR